MLGDPHHHSATHSRGQAGPFWSAYSGPCLSPKVCSDHTLDYCSYSHWEVFFFFFFSIKAHWSSPFICLHLSLLFFIWEGSGFPPQGWTPVLTTSVQLFTFPAWILTVTVFLVFFKSFLPAHVPPFHCCLSTSSSFPLWFSAPLLSRPRPFLRMLNVFA